MKIFQVQRAKVVNSCFIDLSCVEESLMSLEKLDRASPDLWPEQSEYLFFGRSLFEIYIHNIHHICSEQ